MGQATSGTGGAPRGSAVTFSAMVKRPSALLPIAMSTLALATVIVHIARFGIAQQPDEGAAAHIWQLLMAAQLPIVVYFAVKWIPRAPRQALGVIALQAIAMLAALAPVYVLRW